MPASFLDRVSGRTTSRRAPWRAHDVAKHMIVLAMLIALVLAAGSAAAPAALADAGAGGTAYAWGPNKYGQLGNNSTTDSHVPVPVQLPPGVTATAVAAGGSHSLLLASDGSVYAWGYNSFGQLGNDSTTDSSVPVKVQLPDGVTATAISAGNGHSLALASDGRVYAWGWNSNGQLGNAGYNSHVPVQVKLPDGVTATAIAAGKFHSLLVASDGSVYAWGYDNAGQLGNDSTTDSPVPVKVLLPVGVTATGVAGGEYHSLALASDGSVYAWGYGCAGQLGDNSTAESHIPVKVLLPVGVRAIGIAAASQSLALISDGRVYAWGWNGYGQLGNNSTTDSSVPIPVQFPSGVTAMAVAAGGSHSLALAADGSVYGWGSDTQGQLGDDSTIDGRHVPVRTELPSGVTAMAVAAGYDHSLALVVKMAPVDTTPPVTTDNAPAGWQNAAFSVTLTCVDVAGSGSGASGCQTTQYRLDGGAWQTGNTVSISVEGDHLLEYYSVDNAGNSEATKSVQAKLDKTPPKITYTGRTAANPGGWNNSDVTVNWTCADALSGPMAASVSWTITTEGANQTATGTCTDNAGNSASDTQSGINIDKTPPTLAPSVSPMTPPNLVLLNAIATASAGASDALSGIASQTCAPVSTNVIGGASVTCTAVDNAGNQAQASFAYKVIYRFDGFLQPINDTAHQQVCGTPCPLSIFKDGSTVPAKFQLKDANGNVVQAASLPLWLTPQQGSAMSAAIDESVYADSASTGTVYSWDGQQYHYNWSTKGFAAGYYWLIGVRLDDGQTYTVNIGLR